MQLEFNFFIFWACKWDIVTLTYSDVHSLMLLPVKLQVDRRYLTFAEINY